MALIKKPIPTPEYQTNRQYELNGAVSRGELKKVKTLLAQGVDVHFEQDMVLDTALMYEQPDMFWFFVKNYNFDLKNNWRCIRDAIVYEHKEILNYLIECGVDLNLKESLALKNACFQDKADMFTLLIEKGADSTLQGAIGFHTQGSFYLNLAWSQKSFQVLDILLQTTEHQAQFFCPDSIDFHFDKAQVQERVRTHPQELLSVLLRLRNYSEDNYQHMLSKHTSVHLWTPNEQRYTAFFEKLELEHSVQSFSGTQIQAGAVSNLHKI